MQLPNLLNAALSLTGSQSFQYIQYIGRVDNGIGQDIAQYAAPIQLYGNVQAVPRNLFEVYGLDFQSQYLMFYVSRQILDVERDVSGDTIQYANAKYQCKSQTDWNAQNGWTAVIAVKSS